MSSFISTIAPTAYGYFDDDVDFQIDADKVATFVKIKCGNPILSVELTNKMIWTSFEEATCEYSNQISKIKMRSDLMNMLGMPTGSAGDVINKYPRQTLEFLMRQAEPYSSVAGIGGSYDSQIGYFELTMGKQDYNIYTDLKSFASGTLMLDTMATKGKIRISEIFHFNPIVAQQFLLNAANVTNFLAQNFNYESYVNSTIFYVLPVFEDVLRRSMLETANKVRRSQYSYEISGGNIRIYPIPSTDMQTGKLFVRTTTTQNPYLPSYQDESINGVSGPNNVPYGNLTYKSINQPGRQWIREYTFALSKEILGHVRNKYKSIPIPNADLQLDGGELITQAREDKEKLLIEIKEFLENLTYDKMLENSATRAENIMKQLKMVPQSMGRAIYIG